MVNLIKGVTCNRKDGRGLEVKKTRAKWVYSRKEKKIKALKVVKKCGERKCKKSSGNSKRSFKLCGKCQKVFYCSRKHQKADWDDHKYICSYY